MGMYADLVRHPQGLSAVFLSIFDEVLNTTPGRFREASAYRHNLMAALEHLAGSYDVSYCPKRDQRGTRWPRQHDNCSGLPDVDGE